MDCGITAGVGDTSWPHLHNQENPWQAQVLSKANNQTVDGAHLHITPAAPRRKSLLPCACCVSIAASLSQLLLPQNSCRPECAGYYIIPRSPTEVYYDVSTESVEAQLYNWFYCCNTTSNPNCPTSAPLHPACCKSRGPAAVFCTHRRLATTSCLPGLPFSPSCYCLLPAAFWLASRSPAGMVQPLGGTEALPMAQCACELLFAHGFANFVPPADGCEAGKPFTVPSTWTDILNREQARVLRLMLALRPDGHQFHQVTCLFEEGIL